MLALLSTSTVRRTATLGSFKIPNVKNEPLLDYAPGSKERKGLKTELARLHAQIQHGPIHITKNDADNSLPLQTQLIPYRHNTALCSWRNATKEELSQAIDRALLAKPAWEAMPFNDRAAIFLKAADLLTGKYRAQVIASTMLGQGKNVWQAEIDAAAELADFWRFNCQFAQQLYADQPTQNSKGTWNRMEYRPLEGFIAAFSPFNFTAIGGNLACAPALMGNVVLWKPSSMAVHSNHLVMQILLEAGLPPNVIQLIPADAQLAADTILAHRDFAGLHFTGSTEVFKSLYKRIAGNLDRYRSYPRIVGETGGKNMHFLHVSADVEQAVLQTVRSAFEYNGQKCSACSRVYVPDSLWPTFKTSLVKHMSKIRQGDPNNFSNLCGSVINQASFDKITKAIATAKADPECEIVSGGDSSNSSGYFISPTAILTKNPHSRTMTDELFGPVVTIYVYPAAQYEETLASDTTNYALTCALFATDRSAIITGSNTLRNAAGNFYINDKCTGAVVGQQAFGGGRMSGTNDKAGSILNLVRWVSPRTIKESFVGIDTIEYPSNEIKM